MSFQSRVGLYHDCIPSDDAIRHIHSDATTCCRNTFERRRWGGKYASIVTRDGDDRFVQGVQIEMW